MALSFIGKPISLISHSDVRYRGILAGIDPQASTIQLSNVYSMGTETRRPPNQFIAPVQEPYGYIIFRASEVKDLSVDEPPPAQSQHNVHDDPAVLGASAPSYLPPANANVPIAPPLNQPPTTYVTQQQTQAPTTAPVIQQLQPQTSQPQTASATPAPPQTGNQSAPTRRANPIHSAAASLETVERALGDLRVNGGGPANPTPPSRGGRRGHGHPRGGRTNEVEQITVPTTDFDFQSSNAKFEKAARSPIPSKDDAANGDTSGNTHSEGQQEGEKDQVGLAYNKSTSFFDSLSSSADVPAPGGGGGGHNGGGRGRRGGGNVGRNRREEERERNVATFGEPGGVGLLGPGGYVGGWGGYGRRGGRPRRGGPRGGGHAVPAQ